MTCSSMIDVPNLLLILGEPLYLSGVLLRVAPRMDTKNTHV